MKIIVSAGGTYGHIYPALSLVSALKKDTGAYIIFVSPNTELSGLLSAKNISKYFIESPKIKTGNIFAFMKSLWRLLKALRQSFSILLKEKPDIVIGFGGYAAFPVVLAASLMRIKTAIHEQNVVMGKANRFLAYFVSNVFLSFKETLKFLPTFIVKFKKTQVVGNPIREDLILIDKNEALDSLGLDKNKFTILVMGGTSGSQVINKKIMQIAAEINERNFQIIHIAGAKDFEAVENFYAAAKIKNKIFAFSDQMSHVLSAADLMISRAGASVIWEISYFRIPSILIPYPYAGAHQLENARILSLRGAALIVEEKKMTCEILKEHIVDFMEHPSKLNDMRNKFDKIDYNSAQIMAEKLVHLNYSLRK
ncbi:MAG: undecaprenyldiphospho-muramoylpentapeptide beta-N-acetylglucosaminyltransferase [Candidatus Omnitrophica bacterium CG11_big_fil_rev_8_21_14_0_20_42_13]|uniref:UDP-N-acetylglucosamine--N-acetylmuramyl-(pentapeptide) pyrophosphoryl-undecaprenol N-acetylglucosamine transferase n=1 Tax=Candidatus Ghiorseimicrobium undicola TaxID=1974746 RepID=A0A2H0LV67_9BACT|nr:MAG: undecaprenyldiphospho-muramoylpentapeptide beta-N-acetylglucosaminyltransferase [Candidatus Omnitrophica bacterium CG11_big_fil_rev_8_21_14_0_20_42_13]